LLGTTTKIFDVDVIDGYAPEAEQMPPMPQIERELLIKVDTILEFKLAPHTDLEGGG
jgi:hypothetical protein